MLNLQLKEEILNKLNDEELRLLHFLFSNDQVVLDKTIHEIAREANTSSSGIVRLCKKIGFTGYTELKYAIKSSSSSITNKKYEHSKANYTLDEIKQNIETEIEGSLGFLNSPDFHKIINLLNSNQPLFLFYPGGITDNALTYLEHLLFLAGRKNVFTIPSTRTARHMLTNPVPDSILFFVSSSGKWGKTIALAKEAKIRNITSISISPYSTNDLSQFCTYNLKVLSLQKENTGAEFTSRIPIFYAINVLTKCLIEKMKEDNS